MEPIRILHASDFHISAVPYQRGLPDAWPTFTGGWGKAPFLSTHDPDLLNAFSFFVATQPDAYDVILLTGDLAASGERHNLQEAFDYFFGTARPTLPANGKPIVVLPGNHDRYGKFLDLPPYAPGNALFDHLFQGFWRSGQGVQELCSCAKNGHSLTLLAADFSLRPTDTGRLPFGYLGQGRVYTEPLDELVRATVHARIRNPAGVVLWAIHFEPQVPQHQLSLLNDSALLREAALHQIPAIICGHSHRTTVKNSNVTTIFVSGTTAQYSSPLGNDFLILDVETAPAVSIKPRTFRFFPGGFRQVP